MRELTAVQRQAAIAAWLDGSALLDAALIVSAFISEEMPNHDDPEIRMRREDAIHSLPVVLRLMKERLQPADTVLVNYDFTIQKSPQA